MRKVSKIIASSLSIMLISACTSTTMLKSTPSGAKFYANGQYLGEGPVSYSDKKPVGSTTVIEVKKPGFQDKTLTISRSEELNVGALVGGILLSPTLIGLLFFVWIMDYKPYHVVDLEPEPAK